MRYVRVHSEAPSAVWGDRSAPPKEGPRHTIRGTAEEVQHFFISRGSSIGELYISHKHLIPGFE